MEILSKIAEQSPLIAALVFFIWYFMRAIDKKDKRIEELSKFLLEEQKEFSEQQRDDQREMLESMNNMTKAMEKIIELIRYERKN
jgi:uncharacterized coiled-coil protein SlyX